MKPLIFVSVLLTIFVCIAFAQEGQSNDKISKLKQAIGYDNLAKSTTPGLSGFTVSTSNLETLSEFETPQQYDIYYPGKGVERVYNMRPKKGGEGLSIRLYVGARNSRDAHDMMLMQMGETSLPLDLLIKNLKVEKGKCGDFCIVINNKNGTARTTYLARANVALKVRSYSDDRDTLLIASEIDKQLIQVKRITGDNLEKQFPKLQLSIPALRVGEEVEVSMKWSDSLKKTHKLHTDTDSSLLEASIIDKNTMKLKGLKAGKTVLHVGLIDTTKLTSKWYEFEVRVLADEDSDTKNGSDNSGESGSESNEKGQNQPSGNTEENREPSGQSSAKFPRPKPKEQLIPQPSAKTSRDTLQDGTTDLKESIESDESTSEMLVACLVVVGLVIAVLLILLFLRKKQKSA